MQLTTVNYYDPSKIHFKSHGKFDGIDQMNKLNQGPRGRYLQPNIISNKKGKLDILA